ncbi:MAG: hypothetical protein ACJ74Z_01215 [Bryobacteraceae bacterium]
MSVDWWKSFFDVATVVLAGGVFVAGAGALITGRILNQRQHSQLRQFETSLREKDLKIADVQREAKEADARIAEAEQHAAEANTKAEGFRLDIAKAGEVAARSYETAERERLARLELVARLADRKLLPAQQEAIASQLAPFSATKIDVVVWGDTPEIQIISGLVLESIRKAGWIVNEGFAGPGGAVLGILVGTRPDADANTVRASAGLVTALHSVGLASGPWPFEEMHPPVAMFNNSFTGTAPIKVFIGSRP